MLFTESKIQIRWLFLIDKLFVLDPLTCINSRQIVTDQKIIDKD